MSTLICHASEKTHEMQSFCAVKSSFVAQFEKELYRGSSYNYMTDVSAKLRRQRRRTAVLYGADSETTRSTSEDSSPTVTRTSE